MSRSRLAILPLLAFLLALGACGGPDSGSGTGGPVVGQGAATIPSTSAPGDLASLVPANADILVYVPSIDDLQAKVREVVSAVDPEAADEVDIGEMLGQIAGPLLDLVDKTQPIAIAAVMKADSGGEPAPVVLLPVTDVAAAKARFTEGGMPEPTTKGSYVAMVMDPSVPAGDGTSVPAIAENLPAGDIAVRVNLAQLRETFKEQIEEALKELDQVAERGGPEMPFDLSGFMDTMKQTIKDVLVSAESLDLAVTVNGTTVDLAVLFQAKAGSPMDGAKAPSGNLAAMAKALPEAGVSVLLSMDFGEMTEWLQKMMELGLEMYPEESRAGLKSLWEKAKPLYDHLGNEHAMALDITDKGMTLVSVSAAKDADAYLAGSAALVDDELIATMAKMGVEYSKPEVTQVAGYAVHTYHMAMDMTKLMEFTGQAGDLPPEAREAMDKMMATMFGPDGMVFHMANVNGKLVMLMGSDQPQLEDTLKAVGQGGTANEALVKALDHMGGNPAFLLHMDLRALVGGALGLVKGIAPDKAKDEIPTLGDGAPVPMTIAASADGRTYVGRVSLDVKALMDMVKPLFD